jgi:hypothetical protein
MEKRESGSSAHPAPFYRRRYPVQSGISEAEGTAVDPHNSLLDADPASRRDEGALIDGLMVH